MLLKFNSGKKIRIYFCQSGSMVHQYCTHSQWKLSKTSVSRKGKFQQVRLETICHFETNPSQKSLLLPVPESSNRWLVQQAPDLGCHPVTNALPMPVPATQAVLPLTGEKSGTHTVPVLLTEVTERKKNHTHLCTSFFKNCFNIFLKGREEKQKKTNSFVFYIYVTDQRATFFLLLF